VISKTDITHQLLHQVAAAHENRGLVGGGYGGAAIRLSTDFHRGTPPLRFSHIEIYFGIRISWTRWQWRVKRPPPKTLPAFRIPK
jgi:hypothetical protein